MGRRLVLCVVGLGRVSGRFWSCCGVVAVGVSWAGGGVVATSAPVPLFGVPYVVPRMASPAIEPVARLNLSNSAVIASMSSPQPVSLAVLTLGVCTPLSPALSSNSLPCPPRCSDPSVCRHSSIPESWLSPSLGAWCDRPLCAAHVLVSSAVWSLPLFLHSSVRPACLYPPSSDLRLFFASV